MIFAAGLGTRLRPFTDSKPKALFPIHGKTLLELAIQKLKKYGFDEIVINVHHFPDMLRDFLKAKKNFGCNIFISSEDEELLNTGGGLKKAAQFLTGSQPFLVLNVDILTDLNLKHLVDFHKEKAGLATLAVQERETSRYLLFDSKDQLSGWENVRKDDRKIARPGADQFNQLAFSGIHVIDPRIFNLITEEGSFSIIDLYLRLAETENIYGFNHSATNWFDVGKIDHVYEAELKFDLMADSYK